MSWIDLLRCPTARAEWRILIAAGLLLAGCGGGEATSPEWTCDSGEVLALPLDLPLFSNSRLHRFAEWFVIQAPGYPAEVISRCGETHMPITPETHALTELRAIEDTQAALACSPDGLVRFDFGASITSTFLATVDTLCTDTEFDGEGGAFVFADFDEQAPECASNPGFSVGVAPQFNRGALWHVAGLDAPSDAVPLHPCARSPVKLADGWYSYTVSRAWVRLDLTGGAPTTLHDYAGYVLPAPSGAAWAWMAGAQDINPSNVHDVTTGQDIPFGPIPRDSWLVWNQASTHLLIASANSGAPSNEFVDAASGARSAVPAPYDTWWPCVRNSFGAGFLLCDDSGGADSVVLVDPSTGTSTLLLDHYDGEGFWIDEETQTVRYIDGDETWEVDVGGQRRLVPPPPVEAAPRFLEFVPLDGSPLSVYDPAWGAEREYNVYRVLLVDPVDDSKIEIARRFDFDPIALFLDLGALLYIKRDGDARGLMIRPLPARSG